MLKTLEGPPGAAPTTVADASKAVPHPAPARRLTLSWLYLSPLVIVLAMWIYGPMIASAVLSLMDWDLSAGFSGWVGGENYADLMVHPDFVRSAAQTLFYAVALVPFATIVPMVLAVMMWQRLSRASHVYRVLLFLPVMVAPVANAVSWKFMLNPLQGLANEVLDLFGAAPVNWLGDPAIAPVMIVLVTAARVVAFNILIYSAALAVIDRRTLDAARIEGATSTDITRYIVMPQLTKTTVLLGLLVIVMAGQWVFNNVAILTQGGPDGSTDNVYYHIYTLGFSFFETGMASAASMIVLAVFMAAFGVYALLQRKGKRADAL